MVCFFKVDYFDVEVCVCLGFVDDEKVVFIKEVGVDVYNYNVNIVCFYYGKICSIYFYEDRMDIVEVFKCNGLLFCFGVIVGMGEIDEEFVDVIFDLCKYGVDLVLVNFLFFFEGILLVGGV